MKAPEALQQLIDTLIKRIPVTVTVGTVKEIDKAERTCTVEREDRPTLFNVRLNSVISGHKDHLTVFPKEGSYVLCIALNEVEYFLMSTSEIEEVALKIEDSELTVNKDGFTFNNGQSGMIKINELTQQLNDFVTVFNAHTHAVATTGTAAAQSGTAAAVISPASVFDKSSYENEKIKQ